MESVTETIIGVGVEIVVAAIALGVLYRLWGLIFAVPQRRTVLPFQSGVVLRGGSVEKVLAPGTYWVTPKRTLLLCDMRSKPFQVPTLELLTADGMGIRISLGGQYRVVDPASFVTESSDSFGSMYLEVRQALHTTVAEMNGSMFEGEPSQITARMKELMIPRSAQLGIEIVSLDIWEATPVGWLRPS